MSLPSADLSIHSSDEESDNNSQSEFDFDRSRAPQQAHQITEATKVKDKHYDEAVELSDADESQASPADSPRRQEKPLKGGRQQAASLKTGAGAGAGSGSESESEGEGEGAVRSSARVYDPSEFAHLSVPSEIQDLFDYIGRFKPTDIELETRMKPFIPDYIPAIGEIDAFIKIPMAGSDQDKKDELGLTVLDEPAAQQSDPTVLDLQLRVVSKQANMKPVSVRSIDAAEKNPKKISKWIQSIEEIHRQKPPPTVEYSKPMPDIESLMQAWPTEFESILKNADLPSPNLDLDPAEYSRLVCSLLDIPVYDKITESLHVFFTLFAEFKSNAHFQQM